MRIGAGVLSLLAVTFSTGCAGIDRYTFHTVASTRAADLPPRVRLELALDGVDERPRDGLPIRMYEMRIDLEQPEDVPEWLPAFDDASLHDDEGNVFPLSAWYVDTSKEAPPGMKRYRAVFELRRPYRFQSIMAATAHWKLVSRNSPEFRIRTRFEK